MVGYVRFIHTTWLAHPFRWVLISTVVISVGGITGCEQGREYSESEHIQRAKVFQDKGEWAAAVIEAKNALQQNPQNAEARWLLGDLYSSLGLGREAEKELDQAKALGVGEEALKVPRGRALLAQGLYQRVLHEIQPGQNSSKANISRVLELHGSAMLALGKIEDGCGKYEEAVAMDPRHVQAYWGQARCGLMRGNWAVAIEAGNKALAVDDKNGGSWAVKGDIERARQDWTAAEKAYDRALELNKDSQGARLGRAQARIQTERLAEAEADIDSVLRASRSNPVAIQMKGVVRFRAGKYNEAKDAFEEALKLAPGLRSATFWLGLTNLVLKNGEQAVANFARVVQDFPAYAPARSLLALAYAQAGNQAKADETLVGLQKYQPTDPKSLALLGRAFMATGNVDSASMYFGKAVAAAPQSGEARLGLAATLIEKGSVDQAISELEQAVKSGAGGPRAEELLVISLLQAGRADEALAAADALRKKRPTDPLPLNLMGAAYMLKQDIKGARTSFELALGTPKSSVSAALNLAQFDLAEKNIDGARKHLEAVLAKDPNNAQAMVGLAAIAKAANEEDKYVSWLRKAASADPAAPEPRLMLGRHFLSRGLVKDALALAAEAETISPTNPAVLELLGTSQLAAGERSAAQATGTRLAKLTPRRAQSHYLLATAQLANNQVQAARASAQEALKLAPGYGEAKFLLARLDLAEGKLEAALATARDLQKQNPKSAAGYALEGDVATARAQHARAGELYEKAFAAEPSGANLVKLHAALSAAGKGREANDRLTDWLQKNPGDLGPRGYLAASYIREKNFGQAAAQYEIIVKASPQAALAWNDLAWLYQQLGDQRAQQTAEQAYKLAPENPLILDTLGWILVEKGQLGRGTELLQKAAAAAPKAPEIRYHYAVALARSGQREQARRELQSLLAADQAFRQRGEAEALLKKL